MGSPIEADPFATVDCDTCENNPPGSPLWGDGQTPSTIYAYFSGINICNPGDEPAPGRMILTQLPLQPCIWEGGTFFGWFCGLDMAAAGPKSIVVLRYFGKRAFLAEKAGWCQTSFPNEAVCNGPALIGHGGTCRLVWYTDPIPETLASDYNLMHTENTLYDKLSEVLDKRSYRMTSPSGQTNIQIKVDTDEIP